MEVLADFFAQYGDLLLQEAWNTILMTVISTFFAYVIGLPLGVALVVTSPKGLRPHRVVNAILGWIVNIGRSFPFIILLVVIIPFTRLLVGTSLGVAGAIVPLTVSAAPFVGRMVEQSLSEVDAGLIEAAQSFGASTWQIVWKVYLREGVSSLIRGVSIAYITIFGYAAMAGAVGAGGLGDLAIRYGYQRYIGSVMVAAVVICIIWVQLFQSIGDYAARKIDKRR